MGLPLPRSGLNSVNESLVRIAAYVVAILILLYFLWSLRYMIVMGSVAFFYFCPDAFRQLVGYSFRKSSLQLLKIFSRMYISDYLSGNSISHMENPRHLRVGSSACSKASENPTTDEGNSSERSYTESLELSVPGKVEAESCEYASLKPKAPTKPLDDISTRKKSMERSRSLACTPRSKFPVDVREKVKSSESMQPATLKQAAQPMDVGSMCKTYELNKLKGDASISTAVPDDSSRSRATSCLEESVTDAGMFPQTERLSPRQSLNARRSMSSRVLDEIIDRLKDGAVLMKFNASNRKQHLVTVSIMNRRIKDTDEACVAWGSTDCRPRALKVDTWMDHKRFILLSDIIGVTGGLESRVFQQWAGTKHVSADKCFSILSTKRSLDLQAGSPREAQQWVSDLKTLVQRLQS